MFKVVVKLLMSGEGGYFKLTNILSGLKTTQSQFLHACSITAGCDYLQNVHGVGISRAFQFVKSGFLFEELKRKGAAGNYESMFKMALCVFKHQSVFNLNTLLVQSLEDWTEDTELQNYCGQYPTNYGNEISAVCDC